MRPRRSVDIDWHDGDRAQLRPLFEAAEDSAAQLDAYLPMGRVLVARSGAALVGHLQLISTDSREEIELKNMAVCADQRGLGVGRALVKEALRRSGEEGWRRVVVATAAADIGNLRFYQRVGFRMCAIEPDAFTPVTGYPEPIVIDGIPLLDRVWLARTL
jgi:GNAT superfamily N-acetyltransferase